jgi:hypothetical protein
MLTPPLPHAHFFHFSDTCSLDSNGSTKFLASMWSLIPFQRADPAPGFFFLAAKYGGRTCGWCICNQPPTTGSPSVFCSQKKEPCPALVLECYVVFKVCTEYRHGISFGSSKRLVDCAKGGKLFGDSADEL